MLKLNIVFVCTSNRDRSVALEKYFSEKYPQHSYRSAGINTYFTKKYGTRLISKDDICWSDFIVFADKIHFEKTREKFPDWMPDKMCMVLQLGYYERGAVSSEYIASAERIILASVENFSSLK